MTKFATQDAAYFKERDQLAEAYGPQDLWHWADAWPLFVGQGNLGRVMTLSDCLQEALRVPGDVYEFGSWRGATTLLFAKLLQIWEPHGPRRVHAFDFWGEGFQPAHWRKEDTPESAGKYAGWGGNHHLPTLQAMIKLYNLEDTVVIHHGMIQRTWPEVVKADPKIALALLDCDLYEPTRMVLFDLHYQVSPGSLIVADEYNDPEWRGETRAFDEFLRDYPGCYQRHAPKWARQPTLVLQRT